MVAATITEKVYEWVHDPSIEVVQLTASDGETYTSRKFKTLLGAVLSLNEDSDANTNVTLSGQVATLNLAGITDKLVTLILFGIK